MKKRCVSFVLAMLLLTGMLASCGTTTQVGSDTSSTAPSTTPVPDTTPAETTSSVPDDKGTTTVDDAAVTTPEEVVVSRPDPVATGSIKILAIGNSFSTDCMEYLYQMLQSGGIKNIVLGNLYYGGCSLSQHLSFAKNNSAEYTYYKNTTGTWKSTKNYTLTDAVNDEEWDYISFQQTSKTCGLTNSYGKVLTNLVDFVEKLAPNATFIWNMTWAYQQDSTHSSFPNYNNDQQKMYDMIINCVNECIKPETRFAFIIPCMTSVQNARTSFLGDTLTRDGYHLDKNIGRYIGGLTWFCALTGLEPEAVTYNPSTSMISDDMLAVAREAVANAMKAPEQVTQSKITEGKRGEGSTTADDPTLELIPADFYEADKAKTATVGIDLSKYKLYEWEYTENGYWYCTKNTKISTPASGNSTYHQNVCTSVMHSIEALPAGSVFVCDDGWQYRLEIFPDTNKTYSGTRPGMISSGVFVLTSEFLDGCKYTVWNISSNPKRDISAIYAQAACHVRVYVPVS